MKMQISSGGKKLELFIADSFKNILEEKRDPNMSDEEFEKLKKTSDFKKETQDLIEQSFENYFIASEWERLKNLNNGKDVDLEGISIVEKCGNVKNCLASCSENKGRDSFEQDHKVFLIKDKFKVFIVLDPKDANLREIWEGNGINPSCTYEALEQAIEKLKQK